MSRTGKWNGSFDAYRVARADSEPALVAALQDNTERLPGTTITGPVTVNGEPATLRMSGDLGFSNRWASLRWERDDGTWAGVFLTFGNGPEPGIGADKASALQVAQWLRFGNAYACVTDFRLAWLPPGFVQSGCEYGVRTDGSLETGAEFTAGGKAFAVSTISAANTDAVFPNTTVAGRPVEVKDGWVRHAHGDRIVELDPGDNAIGLPDALKVIGGFTSGS